nr:mirror-image polydactyly gene 1 protein [Chrysemys picta bellii]
MEDWSKEICNLEQQREDFCPKFQLYPSSSRSLQPQNELVIQGNVEAMNLSDLPTATSLSIQSASTQNVCLDHVIAPCTAEESSITEKQGRMLSDFMTSWKETGDLDKETNIAFLLKELDAVRAKNKKLQDKLSEKDKELKTIKLDLELQERATEAKIAEKTAALVEEVYTAQRERDEAVMARLKLANEERDEALLRAKHLEQSLKEWLLLEAKGNLIELKSEHVVNLNMNFSVIESFSAAKMVMVLFTLIHLASWGKKYAPSPLLNGILSSLQCKRLVQELHHLKEQNQTSANNTRHLTAENNQERALKAKLLAIQQERETAVQQNKKLEEEIQTLRVYYSLHKSLSQEVSLKDQFNCTLSTYEDALKSSEDIVTITHRQNEQLATQLQQAQTERTNMELKLQQALEASQEANEKVQTLERLVDVLRKKVGAGTIRTVI